MNYGIARSALGLALSLLLAGAAAALPQDCSSDIEVVLKVKFYDSSRSLHVAWLDAAKINTAQHSRITLRNGFATKVRTTEREYYVLHVPVVRHERDKRRIETLGHELLHAICGAWHEPKDDIA